MRTVLTSTASAESYQADDQEATMAADAVATAEAAIGATAVAEAAAAATEEMVDVGGGMQLCFVAEGDPSGKPLLLLAGLGQQLNVWPAELRDGLVKRGFRVIRCDNRDIGRSGSASCPPPTPLQFLTRRFSLAQYDLGAMIADTVGLLDALAIPRAHLVGMSMGGMIAQGVAARKPGRVLSLTSMMSTTGAPRVGRPAPSTWLRLAAPPVTTREAQAERVVGMMRHIGSRGFAFEEDAVRALALEAFDRSGGPAAAGVARQLAAIMKSGDRSAEVARIHTPTLVIHGDHDRMVNPSGGRVTAAAIPGARLQVIAGMGHDLPRDVCAQLAGEIAAHAESAAAAESATA
jgi:pimeloyl-ACP methyl ester carboxylesterase